MAYDLTLFELACHIHTDESVRTHVPQPTSPSQVGRMLSQQGILSNLKPPGSYTPPLPQSPVPSARVLRRAHLVMEMERMPDYRASILSVTGEILCIDGTKQILKKIRGDGQGTMQYVTSVLNEWGQFLTTVVGCISIRRKLRKNGKWTGGTFQAG
ncbi:uncharacterized protein [Apostichopus japonicus]|uniref:uncharacterized protein n=1 Tax=Stichopus japonicus TaxID=307972 RepID=UPI003AB593EF